MLDFCAQGYWMVLPFDAGVTSLPHLRLSPLGVVPQHDRRPRLIVDYSDSGLNDDTVPMAPKEAMQFGRALSRVLTTIVHADPRYGPVFLSKIDVADGFYRVWIQARDVAKLGVVLPTAPGCTPLVAFPLALPMGWIESPPYFTAFTETACDRANAMSRSQDPHLQAVHRLEVISATPPVDQAIALPSAWRPTIQGTKRLPVSQVDVYVDDFLLMAQTEHHKRKVLRSTLSAIDEVFRPLMPSDPSERKEPASVKKMLKGYACWSTNKRILGWDIDSKALTLRLPPHRLARLHTVLHWIQPPHKRLSTKRWHQLLGELRSMAPAIPDARGLFSVLQDALQHTDGHRVRINQRIYDVAADFEALLQTLHDQPTRLPELIPTAPSDVGACDACRHGMGGVWFDALDPTAAPIVWRQAFPSKVSSALITSDHRKGTISISDLELMGMIAHKAVLTSTRDVQARTIWVAGDNVAAVAWSTKGSATSVAARAYLLRLDSLHQRMHRYVARHHYIPGPVNVMADDASRRWDLSDSALLTHFNATYPQARSWRMLTLPSELNAMLTGALFRQRPRNESLLTAAPPPVGASGRPSAPAWASTPSTLATTIPSLFCNSSPNGTAREHWSPAATLSALAQWKTPYEQWARRTPGWGPRTLA